MPKARYNIDDSKLDESIKVRIFPEMLNIIDELVDRYPDRYDNESHFIRCAIGHYLEQEFEIKQEG